MSAGKRPLLPGAFFVELAQPPEGFVAIDELSPLRLLVAVFDLSCDLSPIACEPLLLLVEHLYGPFDEFIGRSVRPTLDILLDEGFHLRFQTNRHIRKLRPSEETVNCGAVAFLR